MFPGGRTGTPNANPRCGARPPRRTSTAGFSEPQCIMRVPARIRRVTDPLLSGVRVPVVSGVNRGQWWSLVSAGSGYASGLRAKEQMAMLAALLRPGDVMWDVGAHHGFVTLCAARQVGQGGSVHAFEPSPKNEAMLRRHLRWNRLTNVTVHPIALSDFDGECSFGGTATSKMLALGAGSEMVTVRRGASIVGEGKSPAPSFVKIDVEGAEPKTLAGLIPVLPKHARLMIAMHNRDADAESQELLRGAGFELFPSRGLEEARQGRWRSDPDLFCLGPEWTGREHDLELLRAARF